MFEPKAMSDRRNRGRPGEDNASEEHRTQREGAGNGIAPKDTTAQEHIERDNYRGGQESGNPAIACEPCGWSFST